MMRAVFFSEGKWKGLACLSVIPSNEEAGVLVTKGLHVQCFSIFLFVCSVFVSVFSFVFEFPRWAQESEVGE